MRRDVACLRDLRREPRESDGTREEKRKKKEINQELSDAQSKIKECVAPACQTGDGDDDACARLDSGSQSVGCRRWSWLWGSCSNCRLGGSSAALLNCIISVIHSGK